MYKMGSVCLVSIDAEESIVLVCDDLFIAKVCNGIKSTTPIVNAVSFTI